MDILDMHQRALDQTGELVAKVGTDQLDKSTPCTDWTLRELLAHLINGNHEWSPSGGGPMASMGLPENVDAILGDDIAETYRVSAAQAAAEWRQPGVIDTKFDTPHGAIPASDRMLAHIIELVLHGWDIAQTTDQTTAFDEEIVEAATTYAKSHMPSERPDEMPFDSAKEVDSSAPPIDRLAAFMGRTVGTNG